MKKLTYYIYEVKCKSSAIEFIRIAEAQPSLAVELVFDGKVTAISGRFQIFVRKLLRLVATEWERCDKPPPSPKILSQAK